MLLADKLPMPLSVSARDARADMGSLGVRTPVVRFAVNVLDVCNMAKPPYGVQMGD